MEWIFLIVLLLIAYGIFQGVDYLKDILNHVTRWRHNWEKEKGLFPDDENYML